MSCLNSKTIRTIQELLIEERSSGGQVYCILNIIVKFYLLPRIVFTQLLKRLLLASGMGKVKKEKNSKSFQEKTCETEVTRKHKNLEKNRSSAEDGTRKYGYISANSVISMAESAGFSGIQEDVAKNLAEDVTYRLRYIVQQCKKFMNHSKRKKLLSTDINEVLRMCDAPAVYGYTAGKPLHNFIYIKEADVFVLDDEVIDLPSFALSDGLVLKRPPFSATGMWLKLEEKSKMKAETKTKHSEIKANNLNAQSCNENLKVSSKNLLHCENLKLGNESEENETKIPTNLIKYYGITCNTLLGHSDLKIIFQDLSNNSRIIPIIPYLLNFITIALNKVSSERQLRRMLQAVEALSKNKNVDFTPYSATTRVINAMLLIVASDKKPAKISHDFQLKAFAAHVLSLVLSQWCFRDEQRQLIVRKMATLLCDLNVSPKIHYGALALLTALGPEALSIGLWKTLKQYLTYLEGLKLSSGFKTGNDHAMLEEIILTASASLYRCTINDALLSELDGYLCSYFGDAMCNLRQNLYRNPTFCELNSVESTKTAETKHFKALKYLNYYHRPTAKKLSVENVFSVAKTQRRRNTRIIFKFAGAIPVSENNLKKRRFHSQYSQGISSKERECHVIVAGKWPQVARVKISSPLYCLFSVL